MSLTTHLGIILHVQNELGCVDELAKVDETALVDEMRE